MDFPGTVHGLWRLAAGDGLEYSVAHPLHTYLESNVSLVVTYSGTADMRASSGSAAEAAVRGERWMPPEMDASLTRPKLDATVILSPKADTQVLDADKPKRTPLLALASLNADTAPSTEVCWSQLLALSLAELGRLRVLMAAAVRPLS
ncbi:unnamed protein product [Prorocentrum cordatum]|uniref:Uncharacterized protein n=1 Tax=Prorocentrum cordatum TaxID=2364126 RepID=A0ABN9TIA5_9DINO|nr:unnamed protein product [Polarella glacialis]